MRSYCRGRGERTLRWRLVLRGFYMVYLVIDGIWFLRGVVRLVE